jgi:hypothetical protein
MDDVTRPKSALKHQKRSVQTISESKVDNTTPRLSEEEDDEVEDENEMKMSRKKKKRRIHEGIRHSKRASGRKRSCYNTENHSQDEVLAPAGIRRLKSRKQPQKKAKIDNDRESQTIQSTVRVRSDDVLGSSGEEVFMHSALGIYDGNDHGTKLKYRDELVVADSTSGEDDSVSSVLDVFEVPVPFDGSHPIMDDQESSTQCLEPFRLSSLIGGSEIATISSDTSHSIHDQKNPDSDHSDETSSIDVAKHAFEESQMSSYITEETIPLDYDTFLQDNERTPVTRTLSRVPSFMFSSEYSCGQPRSSLVTEAEGRRKFASFQVYVDSGQSTPNEEYFISTFTQSPDETTRNLPMGVLTEEDHNLTVSLHMCA